MTGIDQQLQEVLASLLSDAHGTTFNLFMVAACFMVRGNLCTWGEIADAIERRASTTPDAGAAKRLRDHAAAIRRLDGPNLTLV